MIKAIAIDDEPLALEILKKFSSKVNEIELKEVFENALEGLKYLETNEIDLVFLDINMPDISGLDVANQLNGKQQIIFTTAYKEFAHSGFDLDATDYLLKPFAFERFEKAVQKATLRKRELESTATAEKKDLFVFADYRMVRIPLADIIYIESLDDYIKIHLTDNQKPVMTLMTMKKVIEVLPENQFARIHRSYIISLNELASVSSRKIILRSGLELPMTESYFNAINKKLNIP